MRRIATLCYLFLLMRSVALATDVPLSWTHSPSNGVTGYRLYQGPTIDSFNVIYVLGYVNSFTIQNLNPGTYVFALRAFDANGLQSPLSNTATATITVNAPSAPIPIPTPPAITPLVTLLLVPSILTTQATIVWQTDVACSGTAHWSTDQVTWRWVRANNLGTTDHLAIIGPLVTRTHYFYKVSGDCNGQAIESGTRSFNTK